MIVENSGMRFTSPAALASYAELAPTMRKSETSIKSEQASRAGNELLKRVLLLAALASIHLVLLTEYIKTGTVPKTNGISRR